jgi:hypothetical protein
MTTTVAGRQSADAVTTGAPGIGDTGDAGTVPASHDLLSRGAGCNRIPCAAPTTQARIMSDPNQPLSPDIPGAPPGTPNPEIPVQPDGPLTPAEPLAPNPEEPLAPNPEEPTFPAGEAAITHP